MAQGEGFKHITVTAADEEDVVIRVGAPSAAGAEEPVEALPERLTTEADDRSEAVSEESSSEAVRGEEASPARHPERSEGSSPAKRKPASKKKRDDYREATLEDLQSQPMPLAQKVTIIAAVVCIIGAIIYCAAFLG